MTPMLLGCPTSKEFVPMNKIKLSQILYGFNVRGREISYKPVMLNTVQWESLAGEKFRLFDHLVKESLAN